MKSWTEANKQNLHPQSTNEWREQQIPRQGLTLSSAPGSSRPTTASNPSASAPGKKTAKHASTATLPNAASSTHDALSSAVLGHVRASTVLSIAASDPSLNSPRLPVPEPSLAFDFDADNMNEDLQTVMRILSENGEAGMSQDGAEPIKREAGGGARLGHGKSEGHTDDQGRKNGRAGGAGDGGREGVGGGGAGEKGDGEK